MIECSCIHQSSSSDFSSQPCITHPKNTTNKNTWNTFCSWLISILANDMAPKWRRNVSFMWADRSKIQLILLWLLFTWKENWIFLFCNKFWSYSYSTKLTNWWCLCCCSSCIQSLRGIHLREDHKCGWRQIEAKTMLSGKEQVNILFQLIWQKNV